MPEVKESEVEVNEGASSSVSLIKDKKKNAPWIEKYRPQIFEEIMGKLNLLYEHAEELKHFFSLRKRRNSLQTRCIRHSGKHS